MGTGADAGKCLCMLGYYDNSVTICDSNIKLIIIKLINTFLILFINITIFCIKLVI